MAWINTPIRVDGVDTVIAADHNSLMEDLRLLKGGVAETAPTISLETLSDDNGKVYDISSYMTVTDVNLENYGYVEGLACITRAKTGEYFAMLSLNWINSLADQTNITATITGLTFASISQVGCGSGNTWDLNSMQLIRNRIIKPTSLSNSISVTLEPLTGDWWQIDFSCSLYVKLNAKPTWAV